MPRTAAALCALVVVVAACGGDSADDAADSTAAPTTSQPPASTTTEAAPATSAAPDDAVRIADGDRVKVHYTGQFEDGEVFDSSAGREPLEFVVASGQVIRGFDDAVRGLAVGETRTQRVEPGDGYGESDPSRVLEFQLSDLPAGVAAGDELRSQTGATATVVSVDEAAGTALIDTNHPLAGRVLIFEVEVVEIITAAAG